MMVLEGGENSARNLGAGQSRGNVAMRRQIIEGQGNLHLRIEKRHPKNQNE